MNAAEHSNGFEPAVRFALRADRANLWTALPAVVVSYDAASQTVSAQPTVEGVKPNADGTSTPIAMPVCSDCPVSFPKGGGFAMTFPLNPGDEGMLIFSSRCIDGWWASGGVQPQAEMRMHDLSDGMFIPGVTSQAMRLESVSDAGIEMRSQDGDTRTTLFANSAVSSFMGAEKFVDWGPGGVATSGNLTSATGFSGGWTTPTGDVMTVVNGVLAIGNGVVNPDFINAIADRIRSVDTCAALQRVVDQEITALYAANADLLAKAAALEEIVELLTHPTDPLTWIIKFIEKYLAPQLAPIQKIAIQVAATIAAVENLISAVRAAEQRLGQSCTVSIPLP